MYAMSDLISRWIWHAQFFTLTVRLEGHGDDGGRAVILLCIVVPSTDYYNFSRIDLNSSVACFIAVSTGSLSSELAPTGW